MEEARSGKQVMSYFELVWEVEYGRERGKEIGREAVIRLERRDK